VTLRPHELFDPSAKPSGKLEGVQGVIAESTTPATQQNEIQTL